MSRTSHFNCLSGIPCSSNARLDGLQCQRAFISIKSSDYPCKQGWVQVEGIKSASASMVPAMAVRTISIFGSDYANILTSQTPVSFSCHALKVSSFASTPQLSQRVPLQQQHDGNRTSWPSSSRFIRAIKAGASLLLSSQSSWRI
ncbi:uncharacterized protein [Triticum aestivum]|uniref:uncharacterized protein n=1 Tax=Triticum aestivum TaxID=4565 RepID=UPI001D00CCD9|nr:uncharacterized protein LOC123169845 [Triticum aestivum]